VKGGGAGVAGGLAALLTVAALSGCGRYGPPVRSAPAPRPPAEAPAEPEPVDDEQTEDEQSEKRKPQ
jgi:hypothetical protein